MSDIRQETSLEVQGTDFGGCAVSKQRRIIHFSSGETLEEEDSEEEEQQSDTPSFGEPEERSRFSFRNVANLAGRISLLTCDFLGERLAGVLGLNAAKYQYAIDQYHRDHEMTSSQDADSLRKGQAETIHLTPGLDRSRYGTGDVKCPVVSQENCCKKNMDRKEGCHNKGYQGDEDYLE